jgi:ABC-type glycerol-3-phosphate transport system substrate-binding protein
MKRSCCVHSLSAAAIGVLLLSSSCGRSPERSESEQVVLRFAHNTTGGKSKGILDDVCREFGERNPGVRVQQIVIEDEEYQDIGLIKLFSGGNPPDVYFQWGGWLVERDVAAGRAADLTDYLDQDGWKEEFDSIVWPSAMVGDRIYMIPDASWVTTVLWYNLEVFRSLHLEVPKTWAEFVAVCRKAKAAGKIPITAGNNEKWPLGNWAGHIVSRVAGEDLYRKTLQLAPGTSFAHPDFIRALSLLEDLAKERFFNEGVIGLSTLEGQMPFRTGEALFHPVGSWITDRLLDEDPDLEYDFFNTPQIPDGKGNQNSILWLSTGYMVYRDSPRKDLAVRFLRYHASPEVQRRYVAIGVCSSIKAGFEGGVEPHLAKIRALVESATVTVPPGDTGFPVEVAGHFYDAVSNVVGGLASSAEALRKCDERVARLRGRDLLGSPGGS